MAQEKTEKATPKRRQKAREEGQVAKSTDLTSAVSLFVMMIFFNFLLGSVFTTLQDMVRSTLSFQYGTELARENVIPILAHYLLINAKIVAPFLVVAAIIGALVSFLQVGANFNMKMLKPKFNKLDPIKGFKNLFSLRSLVELAKSIFKILVIGLTAYLVVKNDLDRFFYFPFVGVETASATVGNLLFRLGMTISVVLLVLGIADFIYQKYEFEKSIRMSKQEIKDEYRDVEGDPQIVSKRRERMRQMAMNRMIQQVPEADVIITNPTHIAVAIKYELETMDAPIVIAMGEDKIAERIREIAKEHEIEIVENKPLARALYETAEIGESIPVDLYQAVAEVLAFVYRLQKREL